MQVKQVTGSGAGEQEPSLAPALKASDCPHAMKDQLMRAASSITLNLAEGSAKPSRKERLRYYGIAFGSIREIQAIIRLEELGSLSSRADHLAASLYKLSYQ
jgi:four helix bundle protein